ncbi:MAG: hypothetical protein Kow0059_21710 [Candidatus Sumerlaeia bacterium]
MDRLKKWTAPAGLLIGAAALRFGGLRTLPPALWYDEAINGLDAWAMLQDRRVPLFFDTGGHPREPLFVWLTAAMEALAGPTPAAIRAVSAFIGVATVLCFYLFLREVYRTGVTNASAPAFPTRSPSEVSIAPLMPLLAAGALAVLRWHVHFSRTSFRTILTPLFLILTVWFVWRGLVRGRRRDWALAGVWLGAGFYTYLAFRFAPLVVAAALAHAAARGGFLRTRRDLARVALMAGAAAVVLAPLTAHYVSHPEHLTGRTDQVSLFKNGPAAGLRAAAGNAALVAGMFSRPGRGDHVPKHNIPNRPVFPWPTAAFFYLGLGAAAWRARRSALDFVMLVWLAALLQASVWSFGAPNLLRTVGATPAVAWMLAAGWAAALEWGTRVVCRARGPAKDERSARRPEPDREGGRAEAADGRRVTRGIVLGALFVLFAVPQIFDYFVVWARDPSVPRDFNDTYARAAGFAADMAAQGAIVYLHDELFDHPTVRFLLLRAPAVRTLAAGDVGRLAEAWRSGQAPFDQPPGPLVALFLPTASRAEREFVQRFEPAQRGFIAPFPVYIVPPPENKHLRR